MSRIDTNVVVAAADESDANCERCMAALEAAPAPRLVTGLVVAEVSYMLARNGGAGAEAPFLRSFDEGFFELVDITAGDLARAAGLVEQYADNPLDASEAVSEPRREGLRSGRRICAGRHNPGVEVRGGGVDVEGPRRAVGGRGAAAAGASA